MRLGVVVLFFNFLFSAQIYASTIADLFSKEKSPHSPNLTLSVKQIDNLSLEHIHNLILRERAILRELESTADLAIEASNFYQSKKAYLQDLEDPLLLADDMLSNFKNQTKELPEHGIYFVSILDTGLQATNIDVPIIGVFVIPTESKKFQIHQFIFRSLYYSLYCLHHGVEEPKYLALALHEAARRWFKSELIVARPIPFMAKILAKYGFRKISNEHAKLLWGNDYIYERRHGVAYDGYQIYYGSLGRLELDF